MLTQEYAMTGTGPAILSQTAATDLPETEVLDTRFGKITLSRKNPITFPNGLLGMPDKLQFCLTSLPSEKLARFKLLQSVEDVGLSFVVLPLDIDNPMIDRADVDQACAELDMSIENIAMMLMVTVYRDGSFVRMSANTRAPLIMNVRTKSAVQYVFHNSKYQIRQPISI